MERGERLPSPESVEALARHFGLSAEILMSETIANRMFNRYGPESSRHAAERMRTDEPGTARNYGDFREMAIEEALGARATFAASAAPRAPDHAKRPPRPHRDAWMGGSANLMANSLQGRSQDLDALTDAARVAEVALQSALSAAERAMLSGDPRQIEAAERMLERLRRVLGEG